MCVSSSSYMEDFSLPASLWNTCQASRATLSTCNLQSHMCHCTGKPALRAGNCCLQTHMPPGCTPLTCTAPADARAARLPPLLAAAAAASLAQYMPDFLTLFARHAMSSSAHVTYMRSTCSCEHRQACPLATCSSCPPVKACAAPLRPSRVDRQQACGGDNGPPFPCLSARVRRIPNANHRSQPAGSPAAGAPGASRHTAPNRIL